ncbi:unnamed protein product [Phaeothamnion confervicola]
MLQRLVSNVANATHTLGNRLGGGTGGSGVAGAGGGGHGGGFGRRSREHSHGGGGGVHGGNDGGAAVAAGAAGAGAAGGVDPDEDARAGLRAFLKQHEPVLGEVKLKMYSFGAPRIGNSLFAAHYGEAVPDSFRVVVDGDFVPGVPTWWYTHVGKKVVIDGKGRGSLIIAPSFIEKRSAVSDDVGDSDIDGGEAGGGGNSCSDNRGVSIELRLQLAGLLLALRQMLRKKSERWLAAATLAAADNCFLSYFALASHRLNLLCHRRCPSCHAHPRVCSPKIARFVVKSKRSFAAHQLDQYRTGLRGNLLQALPKAEAEKKPPSWPYGPPDLDVDFDKARLAAAAGSGDGGAGGTPEKQIAEATAAQLRSHAAGSDDGGAGGGGRADCGDGGGDGRNGAAASSSGGRGHGQSGSWKRGHRASAGGSDGGGNVNGGTVDCSGHCVNDNGNSVSSAASSGKSVNGGSSSIGGGGGSCGGDVSGGWPASSAATEEKVPKGCSRPSRRNSGDCRV